MKINLIVIINQEVSLKNVGKIKLDMHLNFCSPTAFQTTTTTEVSTVDHVAPV